MNALDGVQLKKIELDPFYYPLYVENGLDFILNAGFFFDELEEPSDIEESLKILCTPISHIKKPRTAKHCVMVTTGSMCPVHDGHIEMMVRAKSRLESAGFEVLGAYIAPDHDSYVSRKNAEKALPIAERNRLVSMKIWEWDAQDWLSVDPWYGMFTQTDLNFTEIVARTKAYLSRYLGLDTEVAYVCGGDRQHFSQAFKDQGLCVIARRTGYDCVYGESERRLVVEMSNECSSTALRNDIDFDAKRFSPKSKLKLRDDDTPPLPFLDEFYGHVERIALCDQKRKFSEFDGGSLISLDPLIRGEHYLQVSRVYDVYGHNKLGYYSKSGYLPCNDDGKTYTLFDDDIYTGGTMRFADRLLKDQGIHVDRYLSFNLAEDDCEILDNRDFILFGKNNGLVVKLGESYYRMPYVYPFVDPMMRCSVSNPMGFSLKVWEFNAEMHKYSNLRLGDIDSGSVFKLIGFPEETRLSEICYYYFNLLRNLIY